MVKELGRPAGVQCDFSEDPASAELQSVEELRVALEEANILIKELRQRNWELKRQFGEDIEELNRQLDILAGKSTVSQAILADIGRLEGKVASLQEENVAKARVIAGLRRGKEAVKGSNQALEAQNGRLRRQLKYLLGHYEGEGSDLVGFLREEVARLEEELGVAKKTIKLQEEDSDSYRYRRK